VSGYIFDSVITLLFNRGAGILLHPFFDFLSDEYKASSTMGGLMKRDEPLMRELVDRGLGIAREFNYLIDTHYIGANRRKAGFEMKREVKLFELFYSKSCDGEIIPEF
jgi:hypothetical protein